MSVLKDLTCRPVDERGIDSYRFAFYRSNTSWIGKRTDKGDLSGFQTPDRSGTIASSGAKDMSGSLQTRPDFKLL